jgi:hypothetical protein
LAAIEAITVNFRCSRHCSVGLVQRAVLIAAPSAASGIAPTATRGIVIASATLTTLRPWASIIFWCRGWVGRRFEAGNDALFDFALDQTLDITHEAALVM